MAPDTLSAVRNSYASAPTYREAAAGVPEGYKDLRTVGDLLDVNYKMVDARDQLRRNLLASLESDSERYPGIIGFDEDVVPALDRAILAKHDILLVGQMGQAKTRMAQTVAKTLLSAMPVVRGSITNDVPMEIPADELAALLDGQDTTQDSPIFRISPESADQIRNNGAATPIEWVDGPARSRFLTATPDMSVKDLVGYIDAVKVARRGVEMYRVESYSPGQLMQSKHGVFCIDELPVLDPRKQVALLSVLQEGRFTTGSYPVVFEPRTVVIGTANPIDYTHSGRIVEPLADRLSSHIHTRYPQTTEDEMNIIIQEAGLPDCLVTDPVLRMLAGVVRGVRDSGLVDQDKGVSVRFGIHGLELLVAEAARARPGERACPRPSDFWCLGQVARFELSEMDDTLQNRNSALEGVVGETLKKIRALDIDQGEADSIKTEFAGKSFAVSQEKYWDVGAGSYREQLLQFPALQEQVEGAAKRLMATLWRKPRDGTGPASVQDPAGEQPDIKAVATELVLEQLCWTDPKVLERRDSGYAAA